MSAHHSPPAGAEGLCVVATDGHRVSRYVFADARTGCQHSPDGDLVITIGRPGGKRRATTSFRAGTWVVAAWLLGIDVDGRLQLQDIEWARLPPTGDAAAVEAAVAGDRAWFIANPGVTDYLRRALPGEWSAKRAGEPPTPDAELLVEVHLIAPGLYSRRPTWALPLDAEDQSSPHRPAQENE